MAAVGANLIKVDHVKWTIPIVAIQSMDVLDHFSASWDSSSVSLLKIWRGDR